MLRKLDDGSNPSSARVLEKQRSKVNGGLADAMNEPVGQSELTMANMARSLTRIMQPPFIIRSIFLDIGHAMRWIGFWLYHEQNRTYAEAVST